VRAEAILAREAFARREWRDAYERFVSLGDTVETDDVELLAVAAHLIGAADWVDRWVDAFRAQLDAGKRARAARCAFWLAYGLLTSGQVAQGGGWLGRVHDTLDGVDEECAEAGLLLLPEAIGCCDADPQRALALFGEAERIGRRHADHDLVSIALMGQGQAHLAAGATRDAFRALDAAMVTLTAEGVSQLAEGIVYCGVIDACHGALELRRAVEWTAVLSRWCDAQPDLVPFRGECLIHRAEVMQLQGNWADALDEARRARAHLEDSPLAAEAAYREGELHRLAGSIAQAETCYRDAAAAGRDPQPGLSLLHLASGEVGAAVESIGRATTEPATPSHRVLVLAAAVEVHLAGGNLTRAADAAALLGEAAARLDVPFATATALHADGQVRVAKGELPAAFESLRRAWRIWRDLGTPYEAARTRLALSRACHAAGDDEAAAMELDAARLAFAGLGAGPDLARAELAATPIGTDPMGGLLSREHDVLALVAAGHTNREIAATLIVSEHTVARHVQNIFNKLGVNTRTAAAVLAHKHGSA
jgi:DNA-binding CsgD family transcriptional regulator/tetratricopeptide (TPR) repeat protein